MKLSEVLLLCLLTAVWPFIHCLYFICKGKFHACMHIKIAWQWKSTLTRVMDVPILNFKTFHFAYWGRSNIAAKIFPLYFRFSLLLSQFQPIFVSFVAISAFVWRCFKAMSLVRIVPSQGPQIRSFILLMMDIIKPGSHMPLPYLWHSCWYCLGYCSDKKKHWSPATLVIPIFTTSVSAKFTGLQMSVAHVVMVRFFQNWLS